MGAVLWEVGAVWFVAATSSGESAVPKRWKGVRLDRRRPNLSLASFAGKGFQFLVELGSDLSA